MEKDHSDREKENPLSPHGLLFPINSKGSFICAIPETGDSTYHTSRGALAGTRNIAEQLHAEIDMDVLYIGISLLLGNLDVLL